MEKTTKSIILFSIFLACIICEIALANTFQVHGFYPKDIMDITIMPIYRNVYLGLTILHVTIAILFIANLLISNWADQGILAVLSIFVSIGWIILSPNMLI